MRRFSRHTACKLAVFVIILALLGMGFWQVGELMMSDLNLSVLNRDTYVFSYTYYNDVRRIFSRFGNELGLEEYDYYDSALSQGDYYYYLTNGKEVLTNIAGEDDAAIERFLQESEGIVIGRQDGHYYYTSYYDGLRSNLIYNDWQMEDWLSYQQELLSDAGWQGYLLLPASYLAERQEEWENARWRIFWNLEEISMFLLVPIPFIIYLAFVTGRRPEDDELHPGYLERIYSDLLLAAWLLILIFGAWLWANILGYFQGSGGLSYLGGMVTQSNDYVAQNLGLTLSTVVGGLTALLGIIVGNALLRKIKARTLLQHSLIYQAGRVLLRFLRRAWRWCWMGLTALWLWLKDRLQGSWGGIKKLLRKLADQLYDWLNRFLHWCRTLWGLVFSGPDYANQPVTERLFKRQRRFLLASAVAAILIYAFAAMRNFSMSFLLVLAELALIYYFLRGNQSDFDQIQEGLDASVAERMKSEQMKVDLITNVSHDLKTPLTSIISYVDLLSKEDDLSPVAEDYVKILRQKSNRLNHIVSDLFDLAKATSGNIVLEIETLDLKRLFEQTLADLEDRIADSGMEIRSHLPEQPLYIRGDGKKLYRVLQNLLDNAFKYGLAGSRIYIDLSAEDGLARATIKNTASYEMDFNAEEVLQRFNRGDKARSSEGSGLGLAIAQSFTRSCGGNFDVVVDGDQFKTIIEFPTVQGEPEE